MGRMTRRAFAVAALSVVAGATNAAAAGREFGGSARREMRGMWLATVANRDFPSKAGLTVAQQRAELVSWLDLAVRSRLNTVIFQVRPTADALWPSPYEPWSAVLTGTQGVNPGWDPLGTAVAGAHARGLQLHAWFNPFRIANHTDPTKLVPTHPARVHPEWVVTYGGRMYYNPGLPEARAFCRRAILDAVRRYPLDAVHFDDYFYPYPVAGQVFDDDAAYTAYGKGFPDRASWRRANIDRFVLDMAARIKAVRPATRFGVSPFGVWRNKTTDPLGSDTRAAQSYDDNFADTRKWVREGWIDYIVPQVYWNIGFAAADYAKLVPWWAEVAKGSRTELYIGEALYKAGDPAQAAPWQDPAELSRHLTLADARPEVRGHVYFAAREVRADPIGAFSRVVKDHYK
ncbi:glycoside hydrolase family 10 protein [Streptomyces acidiscabies]|uniref:Family 10 glycosylhydrolase n=1 Tax=Streptomyces acidiscabies TaxID=42234 RepID=A0AAP6EEF1_9ACTN|nr:family 10 glycosylhydrolase [Streptomyces acidiscabies]MBP5940714.1 family 10 glycosylhydrolase [Streptomyces sp. LBUM 1476]MBZ3911987.1 family 10 glycosylhydrolase [Streptomyces acidiscabies]MDX2959793.1 family 10 glycosylhydrolase [Streptomyces acidiscabies]MDX3022305.1 family 10 glycosylhydrolase [Streptomyces acidiscabies]MDX3792529.1 family 10 glycosylhydrolase [Streptomyces acidiscabies]